MHSIKWLMLPIIFVTIAAAQTQSELPKLNHFDPTIVDRNLDPCDNFFKFVCSKWMTANPIPPDQAAWSTGSNLKIWNETLLRNAMEEAAHAKNRDTVHQQVGDYWASCSDEAALEKNGL